jgi:hypothetical protein
MEKAVQDRMVRMVITTMDHSAWRARKGKQSVFEWRHSSGAKSKSGTK